MEKEIPVACLSSIECLSDFECLSWIVPSPLEKDSKLHTFSEGRMLHFPGFLVCNILSAGMYRHWIWDTEYAVRTAVILVFWFFV